MAIKILTQNSQTPDRSRLSVEISPMVMSHLDHISVVTGLSKSVIVNAALLDALPDLITRADAIKKRASELNNSSKVKR